MVAQLEVKLKEGWFDMGLLSMGALGVGPSKIKQKLGKNAGFALGTVPGIAYRKRQSDKEDELEQANARVAPPKAAGMNKGGKVKKMAYGGKAKSGSSASRRADGCAVKGKTKGRMV